MAPTPSDGGQRSTHTHLWTGVQGVLMVWPWLNTYTAGPLPNFWPWMISGSALLLLWIMPVRQSPSLIAVSWAIAAIYSSVAALVQYFGFSPAFEPFVSAAHAGEAYGNLRQRNQFASLTAIGLAAMIFLAQTTRDALPYCRKYWWGLLIVLACGAGASGSRTGFLQWLFVWLAALSWAHRCGRKSALCMAIFPVYLICLGVLPLINWQVGGIHSSVIYRFAEDAGCASRLTLWRNVIELIAARPWVGWGWGELSYAHFIYPYEGQRFCDILDNAHNLPLHLAVTMGVPVGLLVIALLMAIVWKAKPWTNRHLDQQMAWTVLGGLAIHSLLEYPLWYGPFQLALALCCVIVLAPKLGRPALFCRASLIAGVAGLTLLADVATNYRNMSQIYLPPEQRAAAWRLDTSEKIKNTRYFLPQVEFAELSLLAVTPEASASLVQLGQRALHLSPEPRVVEKLINALVMQGRPAEAAVYMDRYRRAFPADFAKYQQLKAD